MGYTSADTLRTIQYTCAINNILPADATTTSGTPQLSLPVDGKSRQLSPALQKAPVPHGAATQKPSFIIRGGFFSVGGSKRRLFAAGHLRKRCVQPDSKSILHKTTLNQCSGVSV